MYRSIRPLIFRLDPEQAHALTVGLLRMAGSLPPIRLFLKKLFQPSRSVPVQLMGLYFPNPVGLAAGYDKDGKSWRGLAALGFGHLELGTVTPVAQPGNAKPRIFRIPDRQALINRMGFPGKGASFLIDQLERQEADRSNRDFILGLNIGKNKQTSNQAAVGDYLQLLQTFQRKVDYYAVNVSSPNTEGLRRLQAREHLEELVSSLARERDLLMKEGEGSLPIVVKLSPDLTDQELDDALEALIAGGADGVIATNTTLSREGVTGEAAREAGGLSGVPLRERSTRMIRRIAARTRGQLPIIGVGGIDSIPSAQEKFAAGADLIQIYTGLVYQGPGLVKKLVENLPCQAGITPKSAE